eukprot:9319536-Ditylum_brightwellii.AAC.1
MRFDPVGKSSELQSESYPADPTFKPNPSFKSNDDKIDSLIMPHTTLVTKLRKEWPLKSILKPVSFYDLAGSKNPKSLSRSFMSMMKLAKM